MKVFIFMCLAFVAVQVSSAPTENTPTIFVLSSDGIKELRPTAVEASKEIPIATEKNEEKPVQIVQTEQKMIEQPEVKVVELVPTQEKGTEQPTIKVVEIVSPQEKMTEQPTIKVVEQPAVKVEEVKQVEKAAEKPEQKIEISSTEKLVESSKKDETPIEASKEVKSDKHDEIEKKDDAQKIIEHSSFLDQIYNALFGDSHLKQSVTSSPRMVQISFEQPKFPEIALQDDGDDDDEYEVRLVPVDAYQPRREETGQSSMLQPFLRMFNSFNSIPSIFGYDTPTRSSYSPAPRSSIFDFSGPSRNSAPRSIFDFGSSTYSPAPRPSIFDFGSYRQEPRPRFFFA
ncbi:uncharacterized protein LOC116345834 [Contarinia nasturtii]|uniref:uncharacterized protein LOC116345834 n=1 Tax=Contarinia nasturtii TaxID=265458 RepID=UPI0012D3A6E7|nr:uncharacterized protein LOC116345834 [Contarinia nasturtii]